MDPLPTIAIVGRPNVGKSTLFNRLIGRRHAIISDIAGTTRDRISQKFDCNGYSTVLVDTGGLENAKDENIEADIQTQANIAIGEADLTIFVVDLINNLTKDDYAAADILRKSQKPVILVANKFDNPKLEENVYNIYELGFGEPVKVSAIHSQGIDILKGTIEDHLKELKFKKQESAKKEKTHIDIAILGKPNAGKSSLVNALLGAEKVIVSDVAGTTRDSIDTELQYNDQTFNLIDTAGLRRPGKREKGIEKYSVMRCVSAVERSDIVVLLIDGDKGVTSQDTHIVTHALEAKKGLMIAINKIDLFDEAEEQRTRIVRTLKRRFAFLSWAPVVFISAKNKRNTRTILDLAKEISDERNKRIKTAELNTFLQKITYKHMPTGRKKRTKFMYGSQVDVQPPKFTLFFKHASALHFSYPRYIENEIRAEYGYNGTAI